MTKSKEQLVIIGAGGHAKVCYDIAKLVNQWRKIIVLDDNLDNNYFKINGPVSDFGKYINASDFFIAIGNNRTREVIFNRLRELKATFATLIHPNSIIATNVTIGEGTVLMAGVVINSDTIIGKGCIINTSSTIDHDNIIGNFVHISPGVNLAGNIAIGSNAHIGIGSIIINNIEIIENVTIGAGSTVIKNIFEAGVYVGTPARRMERNQCL